jgi:hypothetical protein
VTIAQWLALAGLGLDIAAVLIIGLRGERWTINFWRSAPAIFDTRRHKWIYYGCWWAMAVGFALQAAGVLLQK